MPRPQDALDITDRAFASGWTLPPRWRVYAWTEPDDIGDPRDKGDVYNTDVEEPDYSNPTRGFCKHCGVWIRKAAAEELRAALPMAAPGADSAVGQVADAVLIGVPGTEVASIDNFEQAARGSIWRQAPDGSFVCSDGPDHAHELDEPLVVRWWREDRWMFVTVVVQVEDPDGHGWGIATLGAVEAGTFPYLIDYATGQVTSRDINPLTEDYPVPELIIEALHDARQAVMSHGAAAPRIEPPAVTGAPADSSPEGRRPRTL